MIKQNSEIQLQNFYRNQWVDKLAVVFLLAIGIFCVLPYILGWTEFSHNDIVYNYIPFRHWFLSFWRLGESFPVWDFSSGLGRFTEMWTTLPVDLFSPIELMFGDMSYSQLLGAQLLLLFLGAYLSLRALQFAPTLSVFGTTLFLMAPVTSYFLLYYVHGWGILLYISAFSSIFLFLQSGRPVFLVVTLLSSTFFGLGGKLELLFSGLMTLGLASTVYVIAQPAKGRKLERLVFIAAALGLPLLVHSWAYNQVLLAMQTSIRPPVGSADLRQFLSSLMELRNDRPFLILFVCLILLILQKFGHSRLKAFSTLSGLAAGLFSIEQALQFCSLQSFGFICGVIAALILCFYRTKRSLRDTASCLLLSQLLSFYFCRSSPGEVEEVLIMQSAKFGLQFMLAFFSVYGLCRRPFTGLTNWCAAIVACVIFFRTIGLVLLSYGPGVLWLPARDNYLVDFAVAILSVVGLQEILVEIFPRIRAWSYTHLGWTLLPLALSAYGVFSHPTFSTIFKNSKQPLLSGLISTQSKALAQSLLPLSSPAPPRILGLFHGFLRLEGINDVREYQSLTTARYGRYSIAARLGVSLDEVQNVGARTGSTSQYLALLTRPVKMLLAPVPTQKIDFYYNYVVNAVPPLECDQLRLLGVKYVEADLAEYVHPAAQFLNNLYSFTDAGASTLQSDVLARVNNCGFHLRRIGALDYWQVSDPMPRAFFIENISAESLTDKNIFSVRTDGDQLNVGGQSFHWTTTKIVSYKPARVVVDVKANSAGYFILTDLFNENWKVLVDGLQVPNRAALFLFRGVPLNEGDHQVVFEMPVPRHRLILFLTIMGGILSFLTLFVFLLRRPFSGYSTREQSAIT